MEHQLLGFVVAIHGAGPAPETEELIRRHEALAELDLSYRIQRMVQEAIDTRINLEGYQVRVHQFGKDPHAT